MHTWRDDIMENTWLMEANNVVWGQRDINLEDHLQGKKVFHQWMSMRLKQSNYLKELSNVISYLMTISLYNCPAADKLHTFIIFYEALVHTNFVIWKIQELDQHILWGVFFCLFFWCEWPRFSGKWTMPIHNFLSLYFPKTYVYIQLKLVP